MIKQLILVGLGGGIGSMLRFFVSVSTSRFNSGTFPLPTLLINLSGCLVIGLLVGFFSHPLQVSNNLRFLLISGFCGGYTTFSTFAHENLLLIEKQQYSTAIAYSSISIVLGVALVWAGVWLTQMVYSR